MIYLDHAASTPILEESLKTLLESSTRDFANPSSQHKLGKSCAKKIEGARSDILLAASAKDYDLVFTSSATESNNLVIKQFAKKGRVISCLADHPSSTFEGDHYLYGDDVTSFVCEETSLVVISQVNSQAGLLADYEEISLAVKEKNPRTRILLDACQGFCKLNLDLANSNIDFISIAAHKMGGPRGIAGIIYKKNQKIEPLLLGGGHEAGVRSSTPATSLILSFAKAIEIMCDKREENYNKSVELMDKLSKGIKDIHSNISLPFDDAKKSPYILCVKFTGVPSDVILRHLEMKEIYISSSTACSSKIKGINPMYKGLGIDEKYHKNILRISISHLTNEEEVKSFLKIFKEVVEELSFLIK